MSNLFDSIEVSDEVKGYVRISFSIADIIKKRLVEMNITVEQFSALLKKPLHKTHRMLSGTYNFSIKNLAKIEVLLGIKFF